MHESSINEFAGTDVPIIEALIREGREAVEKT